MLSSNYRRAFAARQTSDTPRQVRIGGQTTLGSDAPSQESGNTLVVFDQNLGVSKASTQDNDVRKPSLELKTRLTHSLSRLSEPSKLDEPTSRRPLDDLPLEIIAQIAAETDATTILALSRTNRFIRAASYDPIVLRSLLVTASRRLWFDSGIDVEHITHIAAGDAGVWARYGKAIGLVEGLAQGGEEGYDRFLREWMGEVVVVKFPLKVDDTWLQGAVQVRDQPLSRLLSLSMMLLSSSGLNQDLGEAIAHYGGQPRCASYVETFWDLCTVIFCLKWSFERRMRDVAPIVYPLRASQVPLRAKDGSIRPPLPFSRPLSAPMSDTSNAWESWFNRVSQSNISPESLHESEWCGCVIPPFGPSGATHIPLDPVKITPIVGESHVPQGPNGRIHPFRIDNIRLGDDNDKNAWAEYSDVGVCTGIVFRIHLASYPEYTETHWSCRITPFGIVGTYGRPQPASFMRYHSYHRPKIWLWRKDWQQ